MKINLFCCSVTVSLLIFWLDSQLDPAGIQLGSHLVNHTDPQKQNDPVTQERLQSLKKNSQYLFSIVYARHSTMNKTTTMKLQYGLKCEGNGICVFFAILKSQDNFKKPKRKIQGCASLYLVQSGRPAWPSLTKKRYIRSNFDSQKGIF